MNDDDPFHGYTRENRIVGSEFMPKFIYQYSRFGIDNNAVWMCGWTLTQNIGGGDIQPVLKKSYDYERL